MSIVRYRYLVALPTMNLITFLDKFGTEEKCTDYILQVKHGGEMKCVKCGSKMYKLSKEREFVCSNMAYRHQQSITTGTIFHRSSTPLTKWFLAIYFITTSKKGISALLLKQQIGVTYKTARRMLHQIRSIMKVGDILLNGIVETDETYIGGKKKGKRGRGAANKTCVVGAVDRDGGNVSVQMIAQADAKSLTKFIINNIEKGTRIITDERRGYRKVKMLGYLHDKIKHMDGIYVNGDIYTNSIEGFWSLMKRGIIGIYHHVSVKYLENYLNEFSWRYNNRKCEDMLCSIVANI